MVNVYNATIVPHFDYCNLEWGDCDTYLEQRLRKLRNRAARIITGKYDIRSSEILNELGWQPLDKRRKHSKTIFIHKIRHNELPEKFQEKFKTILLGNI